MERSISAVKLDQAFRVWDDAKTKIKFISPERARLDGLDFDSAMEELRKRRDQKRYDDHIKRQQRKQQREQREQQQDAPPSAPQSG
jgi:hypothetical protein